MVIIPFKAKEIKEENIWFANESMAEGWVVIAIYREDKNTVCMLALPEKETDSQVQIENQPEYVRIPLASFSFGNPYLKDLSKLSNEKKQELIDWLENENLNDFKFFIPL